MELITLIITGIVVATIVVAGVTATLVVMLKDGYGHISFKCSYDTRHPR